MFLIVCVLFVDLDFDVSYVVLLDIVLLDMKRYRYLYLDFVWFVVGEVDVVFLKVMCVYFDFLFIGW